MRIYRLSRRNSACQRMWNRSESSEFIFLYLSEASYDDVFSLMDLCLWPTLLPLSGQIAAWRIFFRGVAALTSLWMLQDPTCSHRQGFAVCFLYLSQFFYFLSISSLHRENFSWIAAAVVALTIAMLVVRFHGHIVAREVGKACAIWFSCEKTTTFWGHGSLVAFDFSIHGRVVHHQWIYGKWIWINEI